MGSREPALLHITLIRPGRRGFGLRDLRKEFRPEHDPVRPAVFFDRHGVVGTLDRLTQAGIVKLECPATYSLEVSKWHTDRADRVPDPDHGDEIAEVIGRVQEGPFLETELRPLTLEIEQLVNREHGILALVALKELRKRDWRVGRQQTAARDETDEAARRESPAAEAKDVDLIAKIVVFGEPSVAAADVVR